MPPVDLTFPGNPVYRHLAYKATIKLFAVDDSVTPPAPGWLLPTDLPGPGDWVGEGLAFTNGKLHILWGSDGTTALAGNDPRLAGAQTADQVAAAVTAAQAPLLATIAALTARVTALEGIRASTGFSLTDLVALLNQTPQVRPNAAGMLWRNGPLIHVVDGAVAGLGTLPTVALAAVIAALPKVRPTSAGQPWINGSVLAITDGIAAGAATMWSQVDLAAAIAGLPTRHPAAAGVPWKNGPLVGLT